MAKRSPVGTDNRKDLEDRSYRIDTDTNEVLQATYDKDAHDKLDQIIAGVGGGVDTNTTIFNIAVAIANTEESQTLPANTKKFLIKSRNKGILKVAYSLGGTSTDYLTIPAGAIYSDEEYYQNQTIYFQSNKAGDIIEIVAYT